MTIVIPKIILWVAGVAVAIFIGGIILGLSVIGWMTVRAFGKGINW